MSFGRKAGCAFSWVFWYRLGFAKIHGKLICQIVGPFDLGCVNALAWVSVGVTSQVGRDN